MTKSKRKKKPVTAKAIIQTIGITLICLLLLAGVAARIWHYTHHHLK
ncbi:MAG: hypothetical protein HYR66_12590 [Sphingobacteriales bacterium]|nr:hypothetical protein [Sphingobacteriales bacterium]